MTGFRVKHGMTPLRGTIESPCLKGRAHLEKTIMKRKEFEKLVKEALEDLPELFRRKMENVGVVIENSPSKKQIKELTEERGEIILGLYEGIPLSERTHLYGMVLPDKITLFKNNIEKTCPSRAQIKKTVIQTVKHEIAHHFGISDKRLEELGAY